MQMCMVGSFGVFRRAVLMMRCVGSDFRRVVRTALGKLDLERRTRRVLRIRTTSAMASVLVAVKVRTLSNHNGLSTHRGNFQSPS